MNVRKENSGVTALILNFGLHGDVSIAPRLLYPREGTPVPSK